MRDHGKRIYSIVFICLMCWPHEGLFFYQYPSVFWTPKNCRFNLNKPKEHSEYHFKVKPSGKVNFVCPNIAIFNDMSSTGPQLTMMYENMYIVDKVGYETCTVDKTRDSRFNRQILRCDGDANKLAYFEETFSPSRADPSKIKFASGKTYYFISTSNGTKESLDNLKGGHCKTHHMKLKITVCNMDESCIFNIPKCPYTYVFYDETTTTQPSTQTTTAATTQPIATALTTTASGTQRNIDGSNIKTDTRTTQTSKMGTDLETEDKTSHTITETPSQPKADGLQSSDETLWGTQRMHIIIHITMGLIILVLSLSLIYVLITRRKKEDSAQGFSSKLYQARPTSAIPLDGMGNGDAQSV